MTLAYLTRRLGYMVFTLWISVTVVFFLFRLLPGDPVAVLVNPLSPPEVKAQVMQSLGLDRPLPVQYLIYLGQLIRGDLGTSFMQRTAVAAIIKEAFGHTLILVVTTFVLAYGLGGMVGILLAWRRGTWYESLISFVALFFRGAPTFWVGVLLTIFLGIKLDWFPIGGMFEPGTRITGPSSYLSWEFLHHLVLPVTTSTLYAMGLPLLLVRNTMLDVLGEEYVELARAKGATELIVMVRHAARNALLPVAAEGAQFLGWAMGGMVTIEFVFSWPGLGRELITALGARDYPLAQGAFLAITVMVLALNFISDLLAAYLDPRVQLG